MGGGSVQAFGINPPGSAIAAYYAVHLPAYGLIGVASHLGRELHLLAPAYRRIARGDGYRSGGGLICGTSRVHGAAAGEPRKCKTDRGGCDKFRRGNPRHPHLHPLAGELSQCLSAFRNPKLRSLQTSDSG